MSVNLSKGQTVSLVKSDKTNLTSILLGLGWDEAQKPAPKAKGLLGMLRSAGGGGGQDSKDIDLDASALCLDADGKQVDVVYYGHLRSKDGAIQHAGDNLTGGGDGDDEQINISLAKVAQGVSTILLTITSYSGHTFDRIRNAYVRVLDTSATAASTQVAKYDMSNETGPVTALVVAALRRTANGGWTFTAIGDLTSARVPSQIDPRPYAA